MKKAAEGPLVLTLDESVSQLIESIPGWMEFQSVISSKFKPTTTMTEKMDSDSVNK